MAASVVVAEEEVVETMTAAAAAAAAVVIVVTMATLKALGRGSICFLHFLDCDTHFWCARWSKMHINVVLSHIHDSVCMTSTFEMIQRESL